ncbi:related to galactosyltransferase associated protein kinase P58/GTA [Phialocephala subalpina]|uniref:cyclin-dependent kinase n=1 Tax=Phialocephala subalpina TaxID=576137 RepID=A0A1L7X2J7_9HELO|nr:related to galactosyltransferase associated protein kinase P58/GTA [Phialocephala subalpina]
MSTKMKSRWANDEEDAALEAQRKREKEEKKRAKAEKQRRADEAAAQAALQAQASKFEVTSVADSQNQNTELSSRPAKRRKISPEVEVRREGKEELPPAKLLRFPAPEWKKCRSVEDYEKLNDIEEGAYGWVSRAKDSTTGKVVALKRLKMENAGDGIPVTGLREIQTLMDCEHPNIVALQEVVVGEDTSKIENIFLVLDFLEHDLKTLLEDMSGHLPRPRLPRTRPQNPPRRHVRGTAVDMWSIGCIFGELLTKDPLLQGKNEVDELSKIFELCGIPTEDSWPGFKRLPNARSLRLPKNPVSQGSVLRAKFPFLTKAGSQLLIDLLSLNPAKRPSAQEVLGHTFFKEEPRMKSTEMFPTFPSKAGQEKRRRRGTPNAPIRGGVPELGAQDFSGIFAGREDEEKGGGFSLKLI